MVAIGVPDGHRSAFHHILQLIHLHQHPVAVRFHKGKAGIIAHANIFKAFQFVFVNQVVVGDNKEQREFILNCKILIKHLNIILKR